MKLTKLTGLILAAAVLVSGCAEPPINFTPDIVVSSETKINAELKSVVVTASDEMLKMDFQTLGSGLIVSWKGALENALTRSEIFDDETKDRVVIQAKLLSIENQSVMDNNLVFTTNYRVVSRKDGKILYETEVAVVGTCTLGEHLNGIPRARVATNRAAQNNIKEFIARLEAAAPEINKTIANSR